MSFTAKTLKKTKGVKRNHLLLEYIKYVIKDDRDRTKELTEIKDKLTSGSCLGVNRKKLAKIAQIECQGRD